MGKKWHGWISRITVKPGLCAPVPVTVIWSNSDKIQIFAFQLLWKKFLRLILTLYHHFVGVVLPGFS